VKLAQLGHTTFLNDFMLFIYCCDIVLTVAIGEVKAYNQRSSLPQMLLAFILPIAC
jgi:hypothetical protein